MFDSKAGTPLEGFAEFAAAAAAEGAVLLRNDRQMLPLAPAAGFVIWPYAD
jgi:beta-glucosidase